MSAEPAGGGRQPDSVRATGGGAGETGAQAAATGAARARLACAAVVLLLAAFLVCLALSARAYPGGNWGDLRAEGHDLWRNYWCDLMRARAVDGSDNAASAGWGKLAFVALGLASLIYWWLVGVLLPDARARRLAVALGTLSAVGVLGVPVLTYDDYRTAHGVSTILAGALALAATLLVVLGGARHGPCRAGRAAWGAALGVLMLANLVIYLPLALAGGGHDPWLPVVQKLGTVAAVGWMATTAVAAARARSTS